MKKIMLLILLLLISSCDKKKEFSINGKILNIKDNTMLILYNYDKNIIVDSTLIINNEFKFKQQNLDYPFEAAIMSKDNSVSILLWIDSKNIFINTTKNKIKKYDGDYFPFVGGSKINKIIQDYYSFINRTQRESRKAYKQLQDSLITKEIYNKYIDSAASNAYSFFIKNPNNYFTLSEIINYKRKFSKKKLKKYYNLLSNEFKNSPKGIILKEYVFIKPISIDEKFIEIIGENLEGNNVKLSDYKGNVILLDFWAGWCAPCIKQIKEDFPRLKEKYKKEKFKIINFSFDSEKSTWLKFSTKLNITWPNFSNLKGFGENPVQIKYGVYQIPTSFIIDKKGIVIKRIEFNDDLEKELDKVFFKNK